MSDMEKIGNIDPIGLFWKVKELDSQIIAITEERDELKEEVKSLKETILDQESHIMELQSRRPFSPGYTAEP